jgi:nitric oxide reductase NorE protein
MTLPITLPPRHTAPATALRLPGDGVMWLLVLVELATFGLMFAAFAVVRAMHPELFDSSQGLLDASKGAINTWLLIGGSGCVVQAVRAAAAGRGRAEAGWLVAAQASGLAFAALKLGEYAALSAQGIDVETNVFFTLYFLLTGFHFLHVLAATVLLGLVLPGAWRGGGGERHGHAVETVATFWHLVDLLWLVLFPLVYILR